jgi:hypothetical protein
MLTQAHYAHLATQATEEPDVRTACQSANPTLHYDELFAPTTAGACGLATMNTSVWQRKRRRSRTFEQLVRVPIETVHHDNWNATRTGDE